MALPKLDIPKHKLTVPSTQEEIEYRPFLVKEQKVLMIAQEGGEDKDIATALGDLVKTCTFGSIDPNINPMFDIEYVFLQIRSKSVGDIVEVSVLCPDDEETRVPVKITLSELQVQISVEHTNEYQLNDNIKIVFRYPVLSDLLGVSEKISDVEKTFMLLIKCVTEIHHGEEIFNRIDITDKELEEFIDSMSGEQFEGILDFYETMPKLRHVVNVTNPNTEVKSEVLLEGLESFLV
tara:strand:+ start:365 stop:1072 length:708 start_codon:yes stop_codon:yes gene_type:complete